VIKFYNKINKIEICNKKNNIQDKIYKKLILKSILKNNKSKLQNKQQIIIKVMYNNQNRIQQIIMQKVDRYQKLFRNLLQIKEAIIITLIMLITMQT
jgi:hypothetical protein